MKVTLGGDRLGSGNKNNLHLHNYYRSTHNLSQSWTSPMTVGALYPFLVLPAMRNDKFEIELNADAITVPTVGPLFGSFKMQTDLFFCPIRLYQAILHNNPTNIGLKMNQVLLPTYTLEDSYTSPDKPKAMNNSCLWKYLGLSGIGTCAGIVGQPGFHKGQRAINAVPLLAYYDIFKNYYSNKQEDNAYVIYSQSEINTNLKTDITITVNNVQVTSASNVNNKKDFYGTSYPIDESEDMVFEMAYMETSGDTLDLRYISELHGDEIAAKVWVTANNEWQIRTFTWNDILNEKRYPIIQGVDIYASQEDPDDFTIFTLKIHNSTEVLRTWIVEYFGKVHVEKTFNLKLNSFALKNIDDMRMAILSEHQLGSSFEVGAENYLPYNINDLSHSQSPLNGLVVKTYQSDLFNNWVNTEWIDGENGIAEITKIATTDGAFKIDQLNLAEKLYNMLNRVAVSGGTYEDWQDAVYDQAPHKHIESPIYLGGMSSEIVFEQIVQSAPAEGEPLGTLAGRGRHIKRKGGKVICKCDEAGFIIGIVSLTPRIKYSQGNEFYLTELKSLDDFHKPALDGIGFQNLLGERLAWWDTIVNPVGTTTRRSIVGKVPAWIEYMTAVDKVYGDFANTDLDENGKVQGKGYMVLNRAYELDSSDDTIKDLTTYIDPTKYNYAFAYSALDAQNFWVEIYSKITARRKMSAKQIPNL